MISPASRYANNTVQNITGSDGITRPTIMPRTPALRTAVVADYTWRSGDRVDKLAAGAFGDDTMWWVMADANPEILDWTAVLPGTNVRIPGGG